jgi:hypothetical protein
MIIPDNLDDMTDFITDLDMVCAKHSQVLGKTALLDGLAQFTMDTIKKYQEPI